MFLSFKRWGHLSWLFICICCTSEREACSIFHIQATVWLRVNVKNELIPILICKSKSWDGWTIPLDIWLLSGKLYWDLRSQRCQVTHKGPGWGCLASILHSPQRPCLLHWRNEMLSPLQVLTISQCQRKGPKVGVKSRSRVVLLCSVLKQLPVRAVFELQLCRWTGIMGKDIWIDFKEPPKGMDKGNCVWKLPCSSWRNLAQAGERGGREKGGYLRDLMHLLSPLFSSHHLFLLLRL